MGLGAADAISLREARAKRDELMKLVEQGINPLAERRRQEQAGKRTFAEAAQAYIAQHKGGWSVSSLGAWTRSTGRDAASLAKLKIDEIAVEDVKRCVAPLWDAGCLEAARLTLKRLESMFNYARAHGWTQADNPAAWGVFQYIMPKRPKGEPPRHPALEWRELPPVIAKLRQSKSMSAQALEFIALTATRASEATEMRWSEVDMEARLWSIPSQRTKTRLLHRVALSDARSQSWPNWPSAASGTSCLSAGAGESRRRVRRSGRSAAKRPAMKRRRTDSGHRSARGARTTACRATWPRPLWRTSSRASRDRISVRTSWSVGAL
jgi:integrase